LALNYDWIGWNSAMHSFDGFEYIYAYPPFGAHAKGQSHGIIRARLDPIGWHIEWIHLSPN